MTQQEIEEYKKTAKSKDRIGWTGNGEPRPLYGEVVELENVVDRGVVCTLFMPGEPWHHTHRHLIT